MRTRLSPRNQDILWKALTPPLEAIAPVVSAPRCWDCQSFPKGGRSRGHCTLKDVIVSGIDANRGCFMPRIAGVPA